jgi:hypothetical protein
LVKAKKQDIQVEYENGPNKKKAALALKLRAGRSEKKLDMQFG